MTMRQSVGSKAVDGWLIFWAVINLTWGLAGKSQAETATGPLRILKTNPRYFTDGSGKAIYLTGTQNWNNFQDNGHRFPDRQDPPPPFDYNAYLDFLQAHNHNFFRLWRWE